MDKIAWSSQVASFERFTAHIFSCSRLKIICYIQIPVVVVQWHKIFSSKINIHTENGVVIVTNIF